MSREKIPKKNSSYFMVAHEKFPCVCVCVCVGYDG